MKWPWKKGKAVKNWRSRARLIDFHKTKLTIINDVKYTRKSEHVPPWMYQRLKALQIA